MKVLWLCNIMLPKIAEAMSRQKVNTGGWLTGLSDDLCAREDIRLAVAFPGEKTVTGTAKNIKYYCFLKSKDAKAELSGILNDFKPDVVHIFGTEYKHTYDMVNACRESGIGDKAIVHIQGMASVYERHYFANLPARVIRAYTLRDILKGQNISRVAKSYKKRGEHEIKALQNVSHIAGRTDWDKAVTEQINPSAQYHFCNETLRGEFYKHKWNLENCERHSIFISQWEKPIKGFHLMLEAMPQILKRFPDAHVYTTGSSPMNTSLYGKLRQTYYFRYIVKLIKKYGLEDKVTFLGSLDEKQMCDRFLKSHVFVSASSIENSPNSVGEAMLLGVPTVSSDVGGVKNMLTHNEEGFVYPYDEPYMITHYVGRIFDDDALAEKFSENAKKHAEHTHNREINLQTVLELYRKVGGEN